ncbi:MAG TPA: ISLre2 family transposase [Ruminiclostridium sp.]
MYNSIQHFLDFGIENIRETIKNFIEQGDDIANLVLGLQEDIFELGRNIVSEVLEAMDEHIRESGLRKQQWEVIRKDPSSILTSFGMANYSRTYFLSKENGGRKYLVDSIVGIVPHDRVSADVVINAINEAVDSSYRKGGEKASYVEGISKQAVMNKIHDLEIVQPSVLIEHKKELKILFIEADEDHVAQQKKKREGPKRPNQRDILMPKMVYVHEGIDYDKSTKKRKALKNVRYFGGLLKSEDLWLEVSKYIDEVYSIDKVETIYLSGDGAAWIKQGLNWIPKSKFVLDNYHLNKYIKAATAHLDNEMITQGLKDAVDEADKELLKRVFKKILELTDVETKYNAVSDAKRYIENNLAGIEIKVDNYEIVGCSAEGHISHIFSDRLSSRPMGWSKVGADKMAQLRIYKKNGGKIYDLVMAQKKKEKQADDHELQDKLIRELKKTSSNRYLSTWNSNITVLNKGHKTALYNSLRGIINI